MKKEVIAHKDPKSPISEVFRTLRTNIQFMNTSGSTKTILITSTLSGEGKSWVSSNLAVTFAQTGKNVLLIDADMRKGRQYAIWGISPIPGLSNYLSGVDVNSAGQTSNKLTDYVQKTEVDNLYVITAGNVPPNPSELLISTKMVNLIEEAKDMWDVIIIDGTPSQLVTDSLILARIVDSTVIVTAANETKKEDLKRVFTNIQNVGGKIAGIVLNKVQVLPKSYNQSYYYGSTDIQTSNSHRNRVNSSYSKIQMEDLLNNKKVDSEQKVEQKNLNKISIENQDEISLDKTNSILKEINDYLDKEKKNL